MIKFDQRANFDFSKIRYVTIMFFISFAAQAESWTAITGEKELKQLYSDVIQEGSLTKKAKWQTEYCADGTGLLKAWGESFPRTWKVKDDETVCVTSDEGGKVECYNYEKIKVSKVFFAQQT